MLDQIRPTGGLGSPEATPQVSIPRRMLADVTIAGTGAVTPARQSSSVEIDRMLGRSEGFTEARVGVSMRAVVDGETTSGMAVEAARQALAEAKLQASDLDLIISACAVPEQPIPATAPLIQLGLGLERARIPAFDVNASCLSFVVAFDIAAQMIQAGRARNVLIASSEMPSRALPWCSAPDTAAIFGDGAAAAIVSAKPNGPGGMVAFHMETWPEGYHDCELASGGTRFDFHHDRQGFEAGALFHMDGRAAYRMAARVIVPFFEALLGKAGWTWDDVDLVVPHQASRGSLNHLVEKLKIPAERIVDLIRTHGNQIAASIPTALHHALKCGRARSGTKMVLVGTSAGFSVGGFCFEMP